MHGNAFELEVPDDKTASGHNKPIMMPKDSVISRTMLQLQFGLATDDKQERRVLKPWYVIDPRKSPIALVCCDVATTTALIFTATFTPYEVGFVAPSRHPYELWFLANRIVDIVFILDLVLQFFTGYLHDRESEVSKAAVWVFEPKQIACNYITSPWFAIDVISIGVGVIDFLALDAIRSSNTLLDDNGAALPIGNLKTLRMLRAARLVKLVRLLRASRMLQRWQVRYAINYGYLQLLVNVCKVLFVTHIFACIWAIQADFHDSKLESWMGTCSGNYCYECSHSGGADGNSTSELRACPTESSLMQDHPTITYACVRSPIIYAASVYWSIATITSSACCCAPHPPSAPCAPLPLRAGRASPPAPSVRSQLATATSLRVRATQWSCGCARLSCCSPVLCGPMSLRA